MRLSVIGLNKEIKVNIKLKSLILNNFIFQLGFKITQMT